MSVTVTERTEDTVFLTGKDARLFLKFMDWYGEQTGMSLRLAFHGSSDETPVGKLYHRLRKDVLKARS